MNEHDEIRELMELAAVEPDGLDRLEAGDTPGSAVVVGHLVGCSDCLDEMARLRRAETLLRPILAFEPDPGLRERTLALVRAVGVARDGNPTTAAPPDGRSAPIQQPAADDDLLAPADGRHAGVRRRTVGAPAWAATLAAALVIGLLGGALVVGNRTPAGGGDAGVALQAVAGETTTLMAADDVREVVLVDAAGTPAGSVVLSASAGRMLVMATALDEPTNGDEYRCWVQVGDTRTSIGTMRWAAGVAWWTGPVAIPADLPPGVVYGVSSVAAGSSDAETVELTGKL
jgi:hypothetical protein